MNKPPRNRPRWPRPAVPPQPGHNTGPCKPPGPPPPSRLRRYGEACRPVAGYVVCIALGALIAICAGVVMVFLIARAR